ncbi:UDP-N-acetylenolpyruvoylglucosamine reductase [Pedobacter yulinensis]|uniref:UDP-N-acetylenolpyruvoylglucosamine reductase n=1 Tax=Pedobacter yulinensis TaxID=2126353 RepID=A0A2T3HPK4_9SPHI|nr:UDP-N-acetylmuramate dehydrogenase [Pedobacter yulinensis]PST84385.1 UDP-N-acetylenolpyruvoylglucosamine reductase [Pedobacter yulinensis]
MLNITENESLKTKNTFGIDVRARRFVLLTEEEMLPAFFAAGGLSQRPLLVLGGGSNILFTKDFEGLVVQVAIKGLEREDLPGGDVLVTAGAGVVWNDFVQYAVSEGLAGAENLSLIPGTVGASPVQNIGAYGVELKDIFEDCTAFDLETGTFRLFDNAACRFGYRDSIFKQELKNRVLITKVRFRLKKAAAVNISYGAIAAELSKRGINNPGIKDVSQVVSEIRVSKLPDPSTIGNAGSFFKNPVIEKYEFAEVVAKHPEVVHYPTADGRIKLAAGWLIEQCGWKGKVVGHTGTWKNQALVLVNHGGATGKEILDFSAAVISSVKEVFGIELEREVNIL